MIAIVWHSRTGTIEAMARAAHHGAVGAARLIAAGDVRPEDLLAARACLFACPENLATVSGAMKEMFDRCYYPVLGRIEGRAYATMIAAGSDGQGALAMIGRVAAGWRLRQVAEPIVVVTGAQTPEAILARKVPDRLDLDRCAELGSLLAEGLALGMF